MMMMRRSFWRQRWERERKKGRKGLFSLLFASPFGKETFSFSASQEIISWQLSCYLSPPLNIDFYLDRYEHYTSQPLHSMEKSIKSWTYLNFHAKIQHLDFRTLVSKDFVESWQFFKIEKNETEKAFSAWPWDKIHFGTFWDFLGLFETFWNF